jgi:hypothetical protein
VTGQVLTVLPVNDAAEPVGKLMWGWPYLDLRGWFYLREDFTGASVVSENGWAAQTNGGTAPAINITSDNDVDHYGLVTVSTGTSSTGAPVLHKQFNNLVLNADLDAEYVWKSPAAVSDGTNTYTLRVGFTDTALGTTPNRGVWLQYTHSANSGNFQCCANDGSTGVTCANGSTALAASTWYASKIVFNSSYTSATCYVATAGNAYVANGTASTALPNNTTHRVGPIFNMQKTAGTTARIMLVDAFMMRKRVNR